MSSATKIAVAGPNGLLGPFVIEHLKEAGFNITLLTRDTEKAARSYPPPITAVHAKYESVEQLAKTLRDGRFDTVVSIINRDQVSAQIALIDAVVDAKVPHMIPSAFGIDLSLPKVRDVPAMETKVQVEDHLYAKASEGTFTWTAINTGMFLDFAIERGVLINLSDNGRPTPIFDAGDVRLSVTTMDTIGRAVANALEAPRELVANRTLYVQDAVVSQNQLLAYARELAPDQKFTTINLCSRKMAEQGYERLRHGEKKTPELLRLFMPLVTFGWGMGLFEHPDNELLEVTQWNEDQIKQFVMRFLKDGQSGK